MVAELAERVAAAGGVMAASPNYPNAFWQLLLCAQLPPRKTRELLQELGSMVVDPISFLRTWRGLSQAERENFQKCDMKAFERGIAKGAHVLVDPPFSVKDPENFPVALFAIGDTSCLHHPKLAIVGTRRCTTYGEAASQKFAQHIGAAGVTVVSGGASGVDTAAHKGALAAGAPTASVFGCGVDISFPSTNHNLFAQIALNGCLLSQFGLGMPSLHHNFLTRNVVIAGLADALLVVELPEKSGAQVTVQAAIEQDKPVFVVPGSISINNFRGSHQLIRDGGILVYHPDQILEHMGWQKLASAPVKELSPCQEQICSVLGPHALSVDKIAELSEMDLADVMVELTELEVEGIVLRDGPGYILSP